MTKAKKYILLLKKRRKIKRPKSFLVMNILNEELVFNPETDELVMFVEE